MCGLRRASSALLAGLFIWLAMIHSSLAQEAHLNVSNTTAEPVSIVSVGRDNQQQLLHQLAAGEAFQLTLPVGTKLGFAQNGAWLGDAYVVTGSADESVSIPYTAQAAAAPAPPGQAPDQPQPQVQITNGSEQPVVVVAIAADQSQTALRQLAPGETYSQPAPQGTMLGFVQGDAWLGDAYVVSGTNGEAVTVPYVAQAASTDSPAGGAGQGEMQITNGSDQPVVVVSIAEDQTQKALRQLAQGETYSQAIVPGMTLAFAQGDAWLGDAYVTTGAPGQAIKLPYRVAGAAPGPATEEFIDTQLPLVDITNGSDQPVMVLSIHAEGVQVPLKSIGPGETIKQPASYGTVLGFAQGSAWIGDFYTTTGDPGEAVTVPYRKPTTLQLAQRGPDSVEITFDNTTGSPLTAAATNDTGSAEPLYDLQSGQTVEHALPGTTLWFYKTGEDKPTGDPYVVGDALRQQITLPFDAKAALVAAQEGPGSVALEFTNTNVVPFIVTLVDAENKARPLYEIPPGQIVTRRALPNAKLLFFRQGEEVAVADYFIVPESDAALSLPYYFQDEVRKQQAGPGSVTLEVRNETLADVDVVTFGPGDRPANLMTIPYRNAADSGRGTDVQVLPGTKLFFLSKATEVVNDRLERKVEGAYTVEAGGPSIIYLPFQPEMTSQKNPSPPGAIAVRLLNNNLETASHLVFVDKDGGTAFSLQNQIESWRNLTPGTILFSYGLKNPGDTQLSLIGDPFQIPDQAGQTIEVPFYNTSTMSAQDLIAAGKVDINAIVKQITANLIQAKLDSDKAKACWRDTYGRGVGTVPRNCRPGQSEDTAGLCYDNCRAGYSPFVTMCVPSCPAGFIDTGLHCLKPAPVTRDAYVWEFGDTPFSLDDARARCRSEHGENCETANLNTIVYSTCSAGYQQAPVITSLCTPTCPPGMTDIGISCQKNTYDRGVGQLMVCDSNQENDAGLCYDGCRPGFSGVGPVCWAQCPANLPVNCGAACAKDVDSCALAVTDQVTTPLMTAANIALIVLTAGGGSAATAGAGAGKAAGTTAAKAGASIAGEVAAKEAAKQGLKAGVRAALRAGLQTALKSTAGAALKDMAVDAAVGAAIAGAFNIGFSEKAKAEIREQLTQQVQQQLANQVTDEEIETIVNAAMEGASAGNLDFEWTSLDPTGIAEIVRSYNLPLCSALQ